MFDIIRMLTFYIIKEVPLWPNVISAEKVLALVSKYPTPTDVPTEPGKLTFVA